MNIKHSLVTARPQPQGIKLHSGTIPADIEILVMSPNEWNSICSVDVQRDTEKHAVKIRKHLQVFQSCTGKSTRPDCPRVVS
jgi:hypothetical protein